MKFIVTELKEVVAAICRAEGVKEVLCPGELEWRREAASLAGGGEFPSA